MDNKQQPKQDKKNGPKPPQSSGNGLWYLLGLGLILLVVISLMTGSSDKQIKFGDLIRLVKASSETDKEATGKIRITQKDAKGKEATYELSNLHEVVIGNQRVTAKITKRKIGNDGTAVQTKASEKPITITISRGIFEDQLTQAFDEVGYTDYDFEKAANPLLSYLPMLFLIGITILFFSIMMRRMGGAGSPMAFGRSRGKLYEDEDNGVTFDDVAGIEEAVEELREVVEFLKSPEKYQILGARIPKGVLLVGPPGTGKTLLGKAVAGEAAVPFYSLSGSDFVEMFVGVGAARVRDLFQQAEQTAPCIIFIDELDALGKTRGSGGSGGHDEREQTLNALLVEMDGFGSNNGVIVMAATNRPETLDPALLRPGRFDRHVLVDRPDIGGREKILDVHLQKIKVDEHVDVKSLASITSGFVGADLANLVNEAALLAVRNNRKIVTMEELNEAVERNSAGLEKKSRIIHEEEKLRVAYHESGHALVAYSLPNTDPVHKVSIIPRGLAALGYMMQRPEHDRFLMTQGELQSTIQVMLAGTIAEEMIFEDVSSGAQNDLERATEIARSMVMDYGMSRLGRVNYRSSNRNIFLTSGGSGGAAATGFSEQTMRDIDQEVKRFIDEGLEGARHILETRKEALIAVTETLLQKEVIDAEQLAAAIESASPSARLVPGTHGGTEAVKKEKEASPARDQAAAKKGPGTP